MTTTIPGSRVDVNFSPGGRYISFIRHNDIWIQELESMTETRLTFSNPDDSPSCRKASGVAEYIMQEEFDRYTGYYWHKDNFDKYKIVFAEIDETEVHTYHIPEPGITGSVDKFTYPLVGQKNADFALGYLDIVVQVSAIIVTGLTRRMEYRLLSRKCCRQASRRYFPGRSICLASAGPKMEPRYGRSCLTESSNTLLLPCSN